MGRTMQSAVALVAKRLFADLRLSAWRTAHRDSAAASPQGVLAALEPTATVSARPASVTWLTEEKQMWPPSIRTFWWSRGNKSASTVAAIHPPCVCHRSQDTGAPARNAGNTQGTALKQYPDVRCYSTWHGQPAQEEGPNISRLDPALQQQWDHAANAHLGPIDIKSKISKKVWWICGQCPDGHLHTWEASVSKRASGTGCPQCVGRKVCKHNSLATKAPQVAAQWDYEANKGIPDGVVAQSSQPVGWRCDVCGHQWSAEPGQRVS